MINDEVIWTSGKKIAAVLNTLRNNIRREAGYQIIMRTLLKEPQLDNPGDESLVWEIAELNYLSKTVAISPSRVRDVEEKIMR